jgi:hypothetical protein|tara:strand:+ start:72 stop:248 length:177 start_codon:yes stop_codon:yes gene_type:complete
MINAVNALLECFVTGLFTAGLLVLCTRLGWFPVIIVQTMTIEELNEADKLEEDYDEQP